MGCSTLLPAMELAPSECTTSLAGAAWGGQKSHGWEAWGAGGSSGVHKQKGEHPFRSMAGALRHLLVWAEEQAQAGLCLCPERQPVLG